jgi:hypothetical protein
MTERTAKAMLTASVPLSARSGALCGSITGRTAPPTAPHSLVAGRLRLKRAFS